MNYLCFRRKDPCCKSKKRITKEKRKGIMLLVRTFSFVNLSLVGEKRGREAKAKDQGR